jgi:hypothetical protein
MKGKLWSTIFSHEKAQNHKEEKLGKEKNQQMWLSTNNFFVVFVPFRG